MPFYFQAAPLAKHITEHPESTQVLINSTAPSEGRSRRENRRLPLRYRDEQPAPPPHLPPTVQTVPLAIPQIQTPPLSRQTLVSDRNNFGIFRQYRGTTFPSHDPDAETQLCDISNSETRIEQTSVSLFQPYPNQTAFLLGEWYWNSGVQKTQEGFRKLIDIICDKSFDPADVTNVPWHSINKGLADSLGSKDIWLDEEDSGWKETVITIPIPFHRNTANPGPQQYTFPPFRHRSIVSVLKEKMSNEYDFRHFHLEPYELRWHRKDMRDSQSTRVYGELYTTPAFLEANEEIQTASGEPGCSLPRILIGLMFGSDSTHLTAFGSASLWPCYMYFGNESKYRRCKPTCNLCNHIAYFQKV